MILLALVAQTPLVMSTDQTSIVRMEWFGLEYGCVNVAQACLSQSIWEHLSRLISLVASHDEQSWCTHWGQVSLSHNRDK